MTPAKPWWRREPWLTLLVVLVSAPFGLVLAGALKLFLALNLLLGGLLFDPTVLFLLGVVGPPLFWAGLGALFTAGAWVWAWLRPAAADARPAGRRGSRPAARPAPQHPPS